MNSLLVFLLPFVGLTVCDVRFPSEKDIFPADLPKHTETITFNDYNTEKQMLTYLDELAIKYPSLVQVDTIGWSFEGRPIQVIRISTDHSNRKPAVLIDAGIHAREWIAPAVALYTIKQLVENPEHKSLINKVDWHIVPLLNPDGYVFSMTEDRMWRKNRANTTDPECPGVDLNRNFDLYFGGKGTSKDPCEETFTGPHAFSEPESRAIRDYAIRYKNSLKVYLTLHSYGKYFLYPWGFGDSLPRDWRDLDRLARMASKALSSVYGTQYEVGSSTRLLGAAAGGSDDFMKAMGVKYSYTVELPGGGERGFDLPPESIKFVAVETFEAVKLIGHYTGNRPR